ncbi:MAG TPA: response regulator [Anaerolineae bacterium]|nr:response regulator [Anaerolineae bacterium]
MHIQTPRALLVEDDRSWQQLLTEILTDQGMAVDVADSLEAAVACLRAAPHRLAVVDLSLGQEDHRNQDGLRVLDALRRHDPGCTALLLSGYATVEIAVSALTEHGAFTCLRKETFRRSEFRSVVRQALTSAPGAAAEAQPASAPASRPASPATEPSAIGGALRPVTAPADPLRMALVVEDDAGWRSILAEILGELDFAVDVCRSYGEALGFLRRTTYALAVVDLTLASTLAPDDNTDGLRLLGATKKASIPAIVVSGSALPGHVERAYEEHGIVAFLEKRAFDRAAFRRAVAEALRLPGSAEGDLTARELEVLALLKQGMTNKEIAEVLVISENTVKRHLKAVFTKLEVNTRSAAVARAIGLGIASH